MANYEFTVVSNEFSTKDNAEVTKVFQDLGFEETYNREGSPYMFVGSYGEQAWSDDMLVVKEKTTGKAVGAYDAYNSNYETLEEYLDDNIQEGKVENFEEQPLDEYLQSMLEDKQVFVLKEVGNEKLRYNIGCAVIIGKDFVEWIDLDNKIRELVEGKGLLGK